MITDGHFADCTATHFLKNFKTHFLLIDWQNIRHCTGAPNRHLILQSDDNKKRLILSRVTFVCSLKTTGFCIVCVAGVYTDGLRHRKSVV